MEPSAKRTVPLGPDLVVRDDPAPERDEPHGPSLPTFPLMAYIFRPAGRRIKGGDLSGVNRFSTYSFFAFSRGVARGACKMKK